MNIDTDEIIKTNTTTKETLFGALPFQLANDLWFYIHLGNYGGTVCDFNHNPQYPLNFTLRFSREDNLLFQVSFDARCDQWDFLLQTLRSKAKVILGVE